MKEFCELKLDEKGNLEFSDSSNYNDIAKEKQYEWPHKWNKDTITFCVLEGSKDAGIFSKLRKAVGLAFSTWGAEMPVKFKRVSMNSNPDITINFVNDEKQDDHLAKKPSVLAYAYYPKTSKAGVVVFNDYRYEWSTHGKAIPAWVVDPEHYTKSDKTKLKTYNVIHVLIHELGHSLGLSHAEIKNGDDVMDPYYHNQIILSDYDAMRIRNKYGIRIFRRWSRYARLLSILRFRKSRL